MAWILTEIGAILSAYWTLAIDGGMVAQIWVTR